MKSLLVCDTAPTKSVIFIVFGPKSVRLYQNDVGVHFCLKYYKVVKTIVGWLWTFGKMYMYIVILVYIGLKR